MTRAQANNLMVALAGRKVPASAVMAFDAAGTESWQVQIAPNAVLFGDDLSALAGYCAANGLTLSAKFEQLGIA